MYNCKLYIQSVVGIVGIIGLSLLGAWLVLAGVSSFFAFVCLLLIVLIGSWLVRVMNEANKQLSLFFAAVHNQDVSQRYPEKVGDPFLNRMYAEMNRIVALFAISHREQEENRLYYESIIRVLTHEIRNSITPITSLSADLLKHAETSSVAETREGLDVIHTQARNLSSFLDSYHRLTHLPEPAREEVEVSSLFQKLNRLLGAEPGHASVQYHLSKEIILQADPNLLILALINLIRNAMQAVANQPDGWVRVEGFVSAAHPAILVSDNGPGIPQEQLADIFIPFFSTKSGGSGIGLSLSRRIMQLHGGELTAQSDLGVKTIFTMQF